MHDGLLLNTSYSYLAKINRQVDFEPAAPICELFTYDLWYAIRCTPITIFDSLKFFAGVWLD